MPVWPGASALVLRVHGQVEQLCFSCRIEKTEFETYELESYARDFVLAMGPLTSLVRTNGKDGWDEFKGVEPISIVRACSATAHRD